MAQRKRRAVAQPKTYTIGEIARSAGVTIDTLRYYERTGLVDPPVRLPSGYRSYSAKAVARVRFIRQTKALGFSLAEIHDLLHVHERAAGACGEVRVRVQAKISGLEETLHTLRAIRKRLIGLLSECEANTSPEACPVLAALASTDESA